MADLILENVSISLSGQNVVREAGARLPPGRLYVLVGPNGAGKTTLLKAMASLLPLSFGTISLDEVDLAGLTPLRRAERIAYLPQERTIAWNLSSVDIASLGAQHLTPDMARQKAFAELQALGLQEVSDRGVFSLSGGQRARVLLARVLVSPAEVYLLDEPLIALDPAWQRRVLMRLRERTEAGQTVVLSLHDLHLAAQFADYILLMDQGRLVAIDIPEKVFTPKLLSEVFHLDGKLVRNADGVSLELGRETVA